MLIDSTKTVTSLTYSKITKDLCIKYNDGSVEKYLNVPENVYQGILNNGKTITSFLKESLDNFYKKVELV